MDKLLCRHEDEYVNSRMLSYRLIVEGIDGSTRAWRIETGYVKVYPDTGPYSANDFTNIDWLVSPLDVEKFSAKWKRND